MKTLYVIATLVMALLPAATANASRAKGSDNGDFVVSYETVGDETSDLRVSVDASRRFHLFDAGLAIEPLSGCTAVSEHEVTCRVGTYPFFIVKLGAGNDRVVLPTGALPPGTPPLWTRWAATTPSPAAPAATCWAADGATA